MKTKSLKSLVSDFNFVVFVVVVVVWKNTHTSAVQSVNIISLSNERKKRFSFIKLTIFGLAVMVCGWTQESCIKTQKVDFDLSRTRYPWKLVSYAHVREHAIDIFGVARPRTHTQRHTKGCTIQWNWEEIRLFSVGVLFYGRLFLCDYDDVIFSEKNFIAQTMFDWNEWLDFHELYCSSGLLCISEGKL